MGPWTYWKLAPALLGGTFASVALATGCAGPSTPLGAPWITDSSQVTRGPAALLAESSATAGARIRFLPRRQILHGPTPLTVVITDPQGIRTNYRLSVRYNGLDVTQSFLRKAKVEVRADRIVVRVPAIRLSPKTNHAIEIVYGRTPHEFTAFARYGPPQCIAFEDRPVLSTGPFSPDPEVLKLIHAASRAAGFSPAFTTALIAQESSFNPRTVSWAGAIGLTQVAPLAEQEISAVYSSWPRYPGIHELPAFLLKGLVLSGHINARNEWRLDSERSIRGGLEFTRMLVDRWSTSENLEKVRALGSPADGLTRVVLASYNSGYSRVSLALSARGNTWLSSPELREARKYVNRVLSFCDHFSVPEVSEEVQDEDQT